MIGFLATFIGVLIAAFVTINVMHVAIRMSVMYWLWRKAHPRLTTPLAAFLGCRDRLLAIPVDEARRQLEILREMSFDCPGVIAAAEKTVQQVRQAHGLDCEHRSRWHCPSHGDTRCTSCGMDFGRCPNRCGVYQRLNAAAKEAGL